MATWQGSFTRACGSRNVLQVLRSATENDKVQLAVGRAKVALTVIGLSIVCLGIVWQRNEETITGKIRQVLPVELQELLAERTLQAFVGPGNNLLHWRESGQNKGGNK